MTERGFRLHVAPGRSVADNLELEQRIFTDCAETQQASLLFYVNDPCIVLGRSNRPDEWVRTDLAEAEGIPLIRRSSGGGTVYHDNDNLNYSFSMPRARLNELCGLAGEGALSTSAYIDFFRGIVISALEPLGGEWTVTGTSDISLNGRKVSGNAQRIGRRAVLHHGTLLLRCPLAAIERYLPLPPDRPGISHADFITGLSEEGYPADMAAIRRQLADAFAAALAGPAPQPAA